MKQTNLCKMLGIKYPIIQGAMVWVSGANLASEVSNHGGLGVLGAGSMKPDILAQQIDKMNLKTSKPFAVNFPLLYPNVSQQIDIALEKGVKIFILSAGSPKKYTQMLKAKGCIVGHVTSTPSLAKKCENAGVDFIIAEGFEAGGHNGRDELTTMVLIPLVVDAVSIPVVAAGGIGDARGIMAALCLGAQGVQMGTRFLMTKESRAHDNYKNLLLTAKEDSTKLMLKKLVPVRLFKNEFFYEVEKQENACASENELKQLLGKGRAKVGMHLGNLVDGELEVGQVCSMIKDILSVEELMLKLKSDYDNLLLGPRF